MNLEDGQHLNHARSVSTSNPGARRGLFDFQSCPDDLTRSLLMQRYQSALSNYPCGDTQGGSPNIWAFSPSRGGGGSQPSSTKGDKMKFTDINEVIAYYLKNAPKVFSENKKRLDKIMLMRGQGMSKPKPQAAEPPKKSQPQKSPVK
jgi:hypothetical protein